MNVRRLLEEVAVPQREEHDLRVARLTGNSGVDRLSAPSIGAEERQWLEHLIEEGFAWVVTSHSMAEKFPYAASVEPRSRTFWDWSRTPVLEKDRAVLYAGDLPDGVMDKLELIRGVPIPVSTRWPDVIPTERPPVFTVHSKAPLPVRYEQILTKVDPVLCVWPITPDFRQYLPRGLSRELRVMAGTLVPGLVIAVWDNDQEFELI